MIASASGKEKGMSLPSRGAWIEIPCPPAGSPRKGSLPSRGAWIEIQAIVGGHCEECGSLPSRGAWIEISSKPAYSISLPRRSPHGERGLKFLAVPMQSLRLRRSPHGERGLKYVGGGTLCQSGPSLPSRGAWIEITPGRPIHGCSRVAPLTGSVD